MKNVILRCCCLWTVLLVVMIVMMMMMMVNLLHKNNQYRFGMSMMHFGVFLSILVLIVFVDHQFLSAQSHIVVVLELQHSNLVPLFELVGFSLV